MVKMEGIQVAEFKLSGTVTLFNTKVLALQRRAGKPSLSPEHCPTSDYDRRHRGP